MPSSIQDLQSQLDGLSPSDETYRQLLQELLTHQGLKSYIQGLQGTDLQEFIEFLDRVSATYNTRVRQAPTHRFRRSTTSQSPATSFRGLCAGCRVHAATAGSFHLPIAFRTETFRIGRGRSHLGISRTHTKRNSMERRFPLRP